MASRIIRSASIVSSITALSRVLGLAREIAMGYFFGTSALKSAFDVAFVIPNLFRRLFGEGALTSAFVPVFSERLERDGRSVAFSFAWKTITLLFTALGIITAIGILFTLPAEACLSPDSKWAWPMPMIRIMLPYAPLICTAALISGILNTVDKFAVPAFAPVLLNAVWLIVMFVFFPFGSSEETKITILCWSVLFAGLIQLAFLLPSLKKVGGAIRPTLKGALSDPGIRKVLRNMAPAAIGGGVVQINVCLDKTIAFWADASGPAALEYAERIVYLPMGMFATAFVTVLLPALSRQSAAGSTDEMRNTIERSMRQLALIMVPCSIAMATLAVPIIRLIYGYEGGRFGEESVLLSSRALMGYAPGLIFFSFYKILAPAFYAMQDMKTPVRVGMWGVAINICCDLICVMLLPVGWKHVGIAISTVIGSCFTGTILAVILYRRKIAPRPMGVLLPVAKMFLSAMAMAATVAMIHQPLLNRLSGWISPGKLSQILAMLGVVAVGGSVYFALCLIFNRSDMRSVITDFKRRR